MVTVEELQALKTKVASLEKSLAHTRGRIEQLKAQFPEGKQDTTKALAKVEKLIASLVTKQQEQEVEFEKLYNKLLA